MIFWELFITFFKIGAFTFGGGYAMLPLIQQQVLLNGWMEEQQIVDFIAVSESTPGPFAINIATYVGSQVGGGAGFPLDNILGAFCATLGVVLPSFVIILIVAGFYKKFKESRIVKGVMSGLKPCVVGLIGGAVLSVALTVFVPDGFTLDIFKDPFTYVSLAISISAIIMAFKKVHPIIIICLSAAVGVITGIIL